MKKGYKEQGYKKYNASDFNEDIKLRWLDHVDNLVIFQQLILVISQFSIMFKSR